MGGFREHDAETATETTSVLIYDMNGGWVTGPALPRGIGDCRAISTEGEIFISGSAYVWDDGGQYGRDEEYHAFVYRNAAWVEVTGTRPDVDGSEIKAVLLG